MSIKFFNQKSDPIGQLTPGVNVIAASDSNVTGGYADWTKMKEIKMNKAGRVRVSFNAWRDTMTPEVKIFINGLERGTLRQPSNTGAPGVTFTEDFDVNIGDLVQVYSRYQYTGICNFRIAIGNPFPYATVVI
jgi:hypothetical protein